MVVQILRKLSRNNILSQKAKVSWLFLCYFITNSWEQRKYEDLGEPLSGGTLNYDSLNENGSYKCVLYGELYTRYDCVIKDVFYRTNQKGNTIFRNDILFPQSTTVDALSLIVFFIYDLTCAKVVTFGKRMFNSVIIKCYGIMMLASLTFYGC